MSVTRFLPNRHARAVSAIRRKKEGKECGSVVGDGPFPLTARVPRFLLAILRIVGRPKKTGDICIRRCKNSLSFARSKRIKNCAPKIRKDRISNRISIFKNEVLQMASTTMLFAFSSLKHHAKIIPRATKLWILSRNIDIRNQEGPSLT